MNIEDISNDALNVAEGLSTAQAVSFVKKLQEKKVQVGLEIANNTDISDYERGRYAGFLQFVNYMAETVQTAKKQKENHSKKMDEIHANQIQYSQKQSEKSRLANIAKV